MKNHPMKTASLILATIIAISLPGSILAGDGPQPNVVKMKIEGEVFMLNELGAIIVESDDGPKVEMVLPADQRPKDYRDVDLRAGDIIMMFNGSQTKTPNQISTAYEKLDAGAPIKLGLKRDKEMRIEELIKADPDKMPKMMMKTVKVDDNDPVTATFLDIGIILKTKDAEIIIDDVLSEMKDKFTGSLPEIGDVISSLQGESIAQPSDLPQIYDKINTGEKVNVTVVRNGKEEIFSFTKEKNSAGPKVIIKK